MPSQYSGRRSKLWVQDPHCYWCYELTVPAEPGETKHQLNMATLDHLYHANQPERKYDSSAVLACYRCNAQRGHLAFALGTVSAPAGVFDPNAERTRRINSQQPVSMAILIEKKPQALPLPEMKAALKKVREINYGTMKKAPKPYYYVALFGVACYALGAGYWPFALILAVITAQYFFD